MQCGVLLQVAEVTLPLGIRDRGFLNLGDSTLGAATTLGHAGRRSDFALSAVGAGSSFKS